jgi:hypothetical protein
MPMVEFDGSGLHVIEAGDAYKSTGMLVLAQPGRGPFRRAGWLSQPTWCPSGQLKTNPAAAAMGILIG